MKVRPHVTFREKLYVSSGKRRGEEAGRGMGRKGEEFEGQSDVASGTYDTYPRPLCFPRSFYLQGRGGKTATRACLVVTFCFGHENSRSGRSSHTLPFISSHCGVTLK